MPVLSTPLSMPFTQTSKPHHHLRYNHHQGSDFFLPSLSHSRSNSHDSSLLRMASRHGRVPQHDPSRPLPRVAILWDFESCRPTVQIPASVVTGNIIQACLPYGSITLFKAYVERPSLDSQSQHQRSPAMTQDLHDCGVQISYYTPLYRLSSIPYTTMGIRVPYPTAIGAPSDPGSVPSSNLSSAAISSQLLTDLFLFALDNPAPNTVIVLITADEISPHAISALRQRHYTVVLIMPRSAVDGQPLRANMAAQADEVLDWTAVMRGALSSSRQSSGGHAGLGGDHTPTTTVVGGGSALGRDVDAGSAPSEGDLDATGNTPTGDDTISPIRGNEPIPRVASPTSFASFNAPTTSPTARRTTPAETVSSGGTVVDAPSFGEGGEVSVSHQHHQHHHHGIEQASTASHMSPSIRHDSRDILGSTRTTTDISALGPQSVLTNPDSSSAAGTTATTATTTNTTTMTLPSSNVNVHAQPFQPFRTQSAGLGTTNTGSAFTPRPYHQPGLSRVWGHFPPPGLGSPLFPARSLSGSTTTSGGGNAQQQHHQHHQQKPSITTATTTTTATSTEGAPALTTLNTNVSSQGTNAGPPSAVSTSSSLASPTPSSNWTQSPPLRAPMPTQQRQGSSVFGNLGVTANQNVGGGGGSGGVSAGAGAAVGVGVGERPVSSATSVSSVSPTDSVVRRPGLAHHSSYQGYSSHGQGQLQLQHSATFGRSSSIGFGSSSSVASAAAGGFGLTTSPTLSREPQQQLPPRSQVQGLVGSQGGHVRSPSMASSYMSPPPPSMMPLHRQQQQQRQDSLVQQQQQQQQQQQMGGSVGLAHQHSFHPQQQQQQQQPQPIYGNPHVAPNLNRRGYSSDQFGFGPTQGTYNPHPGAMRDLGPEGARAGMVAPPPSGGGYQAHRHAMGAGSGGGSIGGSGGGVYGPNANVVMPPTTRPISPRHFSLLLNILREFRMEGKLRPYRSKIGSELVQRDRMVYQRANVGGFKEYVGQAEQMGYVRLGGHSGSPGKEWIELVVNE